MPYIEFLKIFSLSEKMSLFYLLITNVLKNADYGKFESLRTRLSKSEEKFKDTN